MRTDGWTDIVKLMAEFLQLLVDEAPKRAHFIA
jgi:hypothetical protein